ncbi:MAG: hypothetical protein ACLRT4_20210 [Thomasclavelia sp.]
MDDEDKETIEAMEKLRKEFKDMKGDIVDNLIALDVSTVTEFYFKNLLNAKYTANN